MPESFLKDIAILLVLCTVVLIVCHRLRVPSLVGIVLSGAIVGPHGLGFISAIDTVELLSQIGLMLLLFSIGMEFSLKRLLAMRWTFFLGGFLQVALTLLAGTATAQLLGRPLGESLFFGCLLSLSSTAIVLKVLGDRSEEHSPHGHVITSVLIFQDIVTIPMILLVPLFAGVHTVTSGTALWLFGKGLLILAAGLFLSAKVVPKLLYLVAKTHSRTLFLLAILSACFTITWLGVILGLSLSLGAFLAGLILSDTEYRHQAIGEVLPFEDVFISFFFISIGMLVDDRFLLTHLTLITSLTACVIALKALCAAVAILILGLPPRTVVLSSLALSQIGEFSFVLARSGMSYGLGVEYNYQLFLAISLLSMIACPFLIGAAPWIAAQVAKLPFAQSFRAESPGRSVHSELGECTMFCVNV